MKKKLMLLICVLLLGTGLVAVAAERDIKIVIDQKAVEFSDGKPFVDANGRTQVPVLYIAKSLGASVSWDGKAKQATFIKGGKKVVFNIGSKLYTVNGFTFEMDTEAIVVAGRTYVPIKYIAEAFGKEVKWNGTTQTIGLDQFQMPQWFGFAISPDRLVSDKGTRNLKHFENVKMFQGVLTLPVQRVVELYNGQFHLDQAQKKISILMNNHSYELNLYSNKAKIDGQAVELDCDVTLDNASGTVYVPASMLQINTSNVDMLEINTSTVLFKRNDIEITKDYLGDIKTNNVSAKAMDTKEYTQGLPVDVEKKANQIVAGLLSANMTDYEKVIAVNAYIVNHGAYDLEKYQQILKGTGVTDSYDMIRYNTGVCEDYSRAAGCRDH